VLKRAFYFLLGYWYGMVRYQDISYGWHQWTLCAQADEAHIQTHYSVAPLSALT